MGFAKPAEDDGGNTTWGLAVKDYKPRAAHMTIQR